MVLSEQWGGGWSLCLFVFALQFARLRLHVRKRLLQRLGGAVGWWAGGW